MDALDIQPDTDDLHTAEQPLLRLEFPVATIRRLMESGVLCAADFRCLDADSKSVVRRLCLACCAKNLIRWARPCPRVDEHTTGSPCAEPCIPMQTATG